MPDMLVTPEELASWLKTTLDNLPTVQLMLRAATAVVQDGARQRLLQATSTITVAAPAGRYLDLPQRPLVSIASVAVDGVTVTDHLIRGGRLWRRAGWRTSAASSNPLVSYRDPDPVDVTITYTHGWTCTWAGDGTYTGHQRLEYARSIVIGLAAGVFGGAGAGVTREQIDDYAVAYDAMAGRLEATPAIREGLRRAYGRAVGTIAMSAC